MTARRKPGTSLIAPTVALVAALSPFLGCTGTQGHKPASLRRPNVLFLLSDDQRFDTVAALGNRAIRTPNLDRLVREGVSFSRAYIMGGDNAAVCVPSRAMLLSGRTLFRSQPFIEGKSLPETFRQAGYHTFATGKWHNGTGLFARAFDSGGPIFFGGMSDHTSVPIHEFDPAGRYLKERQRTGEKFSSELFSDSAVRFLHEYRGEAPFFLYVAYTAPHDPRTAPERIRKTYHPDRIALPPNFARRHPFDNGEMEVRDEKLAPWPRTPDIVRKHIADYYAMITHLDEQLGRVLDALEETGRAADTIVVFSSDNGLAVGQHGLMGKQSVYEHSVHVPLIVKAPGVPGNRRSDALCYLIDVYPTLCELAGIARPDSVEGSSLADVLRGEEFRARPSLFFAYKDLHRSVRDERYKLIEYYSGREKKRRTNVQLFDLVEDPWETRNLAALEVHSELKARLRAELTDWMKRLDDPLRIRVLDPPPGNR